MSSVLDMIALRTAKDLGAFIRERRRRLGLDQRALAERVGVSRQWIIEAEQGKPRAAIGLLLRTLDALGVTLAVDDNAPERGAARPVASSPDIDAIVRRSRKARR
jgi:HTH-type transcriptional regulator/antitoxin HipB